MNQFLIIISYETPNQFRNNRLHGWDDEDSEAVFVFAASKEQAEDWGRQVAEKFISELYKDEKDIPKRLPFDIVLVDDYKDVYSSEQLAKIQQVKYGQFPDIQAMLKKYQ